MPLIGPYIQNLKMAFCPPEGTHIVPSIELRIMAMWKLSQNNDVTPKDSSLH